MGATDEGFEYEISANPEKSIRGVERAEGSLDGLADKAKQVGNVIQDAFDKKAPVDAAGAFDAATGSLADFVTQLAEAAKREREFAEETARWKSEQVTFISQELSMLQKMAKPLQDYTKDLGTLDRLMEKGAITVAQYEDEVTKLNRTFERTQPASTQLAKRVDQPSFGPIFDPAKAGQGGGGSSGGGDEGGSLLAAFLSKGGHAGSIMEDVTAKAVIQKAAIAALIIEVAHLGDEYTMLQNRMRMVTGSTGDVSEAQGRVVDAAARARTSVEAFSETLVKLRASTASLGLSTNDTIQLTETLAKGLKSSGAGAAESTRVMSELTHAFSGGVVQGRTFLALMRNAPVLITALAEAAGMTREKFIELGHSGKLTADMLAEDFMKAKPIIDKMFDKTEAPLADQIVVFKDKLMLMIGELVHATNILPLLGSVLGLVGSAFTGVATILAPIVGVVGALLKAFKDLADFVPGGMGVIGMAVGALIEGPLGAFIIVISAIGALVQALGRLKDAFFGPSEEAKKMAEEIDAAHRKTAGSFHILETAAEKAKKTEEDFHAAVGHHAKDQAYDKMLIARMEKTNDLIKVLAAARHEHTLLAAEANDDGDKQKYATEIMILRTLATEESTAKNQKLRDVLESINRTSSVLNRELDTGTKAIESWTDNINKLRDAVDSLNKALHATDPNKSINPNSALGIELQRKADDAQRKLEQSTKSYGATVLHVIQAEVDHTRKLEDFKSALNDGSYSVKEHNAIMIAYQTELKKAADHVKRLRSEEEKLEDSIVKQAKEFEAKMHALDTVYGKGRISLTQYHEELKKLIDSYKGIDIQKILAEDQLYNAAAKLATERQTGTPGKNDLRLFAAEAEASIDELTRALERGEITIDKYYKSARDLADLPKGGHFSELDVFGGTTGDPTFDKQLKDRDRAQADAEERINAMYRKGASEPGLNLDHDLTLINSVATAAEKYTAEVNAMHLALIGSNVPAETQVKLFEKIKNEYVTSQDPAKAYNKALAEQEELFRLGIMSSEEYEKQLEKIAVQHNQDPGKQFLAYLRAEANETTLQVNLMKSAFDALANAIINVAITGKQSFGDLVVALLDQMTALIIKAELAKLAMMLFAPSAVNTGALVGVGQNVGGAISDLVGNIGTTFGGLFASGGEGIVGGSGGTDGVLFVARVTPGEHYRFTPPGRIPEGLSAGQQMMPPIYVSGPTIHNHYDRRAIYQGMNSRDGRRAVINTVNRERNAIRKTLRG